MTDERAMDDPESDLDNALLARALREALHAAPPSPVDAAYRAESIHAAIQHAWPQGMPPAAEHGHDLEPGPDAGQSHDAGPGTPPDPGHGGSGLEHVHEAIQHAWDHVSDHLHLPHHGHPDHGHPDHDPGHRGPHGDPGPHHEH
jgi:hypothetical protein